MNFWHQLLQVLAKLAICLLHLPNWIASLLTLLVLLLVSKCCGVSSAELFELLRAIDAQHSTPQWVEPQTADTCKVAPLTSQQTTLTDSWLWPELSRKSPNLYLTENDTSYTSNASWTDSLMARTDAGDAPK